MSAGGSVEKKYLTGSGVVREGISQTAGDIQTDPLSRWEKYGSGGTSEEVGETT
jgi:hypothetical protein